MAHGNEINNKRYYWLKLDRHFFRDARIKKLRRIAGGDTYTIIYLKLMLDKLMRRRELIVINGLTDEERSRYRLDYKEGELLSADMYYKLLDLDVKVLYEIFPKLCESHQRIVAKLFISAYEDGDNRIHPDTVKVLNNLSKKTDPDGMFTPILKDMGRKLSE